MSQTHLPPIDRKYPFSKGFWRGTATFHLRDQRRGSDISISKLEKCRSNANVGKAANYSNPLTTL